MCWDRSPPIPAVGGDLFQARRPTRLAPALGFDLADPAGGGGSMHRPHPLPPRLLGPSSYLSRHALDVGWRESSATAFETMRRAAGDTEVLVYNAGYLEGRAWPREQELREFFPVEMCETAMDIACRGPFLVAKEVLPARRAKGRGS